MQNRFYKYISLTLSAIALSTSLNAEISTNNITISNGDSLTADKLELINENQILNIQGKDTQGNASKVTLSDSLNAGSKDSIINNSTINISSGASLESKILNIQNANNFTLNMLDSATSNIESISTNNAKNLNINVNKSVLTFSDSAFSNIDLQNLNITANKTSAIVFKKGDLNLDNIESTSMNLSGAGNILKFEEADKGIVINNKILNINLNNTQNLNIKANNATINLGYIKSSATKNMLSGNLNATNTTISMQDSSLSISGKISLDNSMLTASNVAITNGTDSITLQNNSNANIKNLVFSKATSYEDSKIDVKTSSNLNAQNIIFDSGANITLNASQFGFSENNTKGNFVASNIILRNKAKLVSMQDLNLLEGQTLTIGTLGVKAAIPGVIVNSSRDTSSLVMKNNTLNLADGVTLNIAGGQHLNTSGNSTLDVKEIKLEGKDSHANANMNIQFYGNAKVGQMTLNNATLNLVTYRTDPSRNNAPIITTKYTQAAINTDMKISLTNHAILSIDRYTLDNANNLAGNITADSTSYMAFGIMQYASNGTTGKFGVSTIIQNELNITGVGKNGNFTAIDFTNATTNASNLNLDSNAKLKITLDNSIYKGSATTTIDTNKAYELIKANSTTDNRIDKRIQFVWGSEAKNDISKQYFIVGKVLDSGITLTFLDESPYTQMTKGDFGYVDSKLSNVDSNTKKLAQIVQEDVINKGYIDGNTTTQNLDKMNNMLDEALRSDDYTKFVDYLEGIHSNMQTLSTNDIRSISDNILIANNNTMNNRVAYIRLARNIESSEVKLALNDTNNNVASDYDSNIIHTLRPISKDSSSAYADNAWANIAGGYLGGKNVGNLGFYNINGGYDKILSNDILIGALLGFGGAKGAYNNISDTTYIVNTGLYMHAPFKRHEISSNLNLSLFLVSRDISASNLSDNAYSRNIATSWNTYYKYSFNLGNLKGFSQTIKPVGMIGIGLKVINDMNGKNIYKLRGYNDISMELGVGAQYVLSKKNSFYLAEFLIRQPLFHTIKSVDITLLNAQSAMKFTLPTDSTAFELNLNAAYRIKNNMYMQYAITTLLSTNSIFGIKGDARFGYQF